MMNANKMMHGRTASAGFSLVELMVGVTIGLLATIVIFQVFAVSEGQKRTTTSGSDAEQNGAFAVHNLESFLRAAGNNITNTVPANAASVPVASQIAGCTINMGLVFTGPPVSLVVGQTVRAIPVMITDGGGGVSDTITIFGGSAAGMGAPVSLSGTVGVGSTAIPVASTFGLTTAVGATPADLVLLAESQAVGTATCTLARVATIGPVAPAPGAWVAGSGTINVAQGAVANYSKQGALYNLGPNLIAFTYSVINNQLVATDLTGVLPPVVVADQVVNIQAQYGVDTTVPPDGVIDTWVDPTGVWAFPAPPAALTATQIQQVAQIRAVRIGIVVRSGQVERPPTAGACTTTPNLNLPVPLSNVAAATPSMSASAAIDTTNITTPNCYRYKTYETVIPIRNPIWSDVNSL